MNKYLKIDRKALKTTLEQAGISVISLRAQHDGSFSLSIEDSQDNKTIKQARLFKALLPFGQMVVLMPGGYDWRIALVESEITTESVAKLFEALAKTVQLAEMFELSTDELASRVVLTDLDTLAISRVEGTLIARDGSGQFFYLPENPFVQYMLPIGPDSEPEIDVEHAQWLLGNDREGVYYLLTLNKQMNVDGRILAIDRKGELALVERDNVLTIEPPSEKIVVWQLASTGRRVVYQLQQDWYGPAVSVDVHPKSESWSTIRVSYRSHYRQDYQTEIGWYSTSGDLAEGRAFYAAYGLALEIAHQLEAMGLSNE